jgi:hypothetical protein
VKTELSDVKRKLQESEESQNKRRCVDDAAQKEVEDGIYYFVKGVIRMKRKQGGIRAKLYEYAENHKVAQRILILSIILFAGLGHSFQSSLKQPLFKTRAVSDTNLSSNACIVVQCTYLAVGQDRPNLSRWMWSSILKHVFVRPSVRS